MKTTISNESFHGTMSIGIVSGDAFTADISIFTAKRDAEIEGGKWFLSLSNLHGAELMDTTSALNSTKAIINALENLRKGEISEREFVAVWAELLEEATS